MEYDVWQGDDTTPDDQQVVGVSDIAKDEVDSASRLYKDEVRQRSAIETQTRTGSAANRFSFSKIRSMLDSVLSHSTAKSATLSSEEYLRNLNSDANTNWSVLPDPESQADLCHIPSGLELDSYCDPDDLNGNSEAQKFQSQLSNALNQLNGIEVNTECAAKTSFKIGFGFAGPKTEDSSDLLKQTFNSWRLGHPGVHQAEKTVLENCDTSALLMIHLGTDGAIRVRHAEGGFVSHTVSSSMFDKTLQIAETRTSAFTPRTKPIRTAIMVADLLRLQFTRQVRLPRQPTQAYALAAIFTIVTILFTGALIQTYKTMMSRAASTQGRKKKKRRKAPQGGGPQGGGPRGGDPRGGAVENNLEEDDQELLLNDDIELLSSPR